MSEQIKRCPIHNVPMSKSYVEGESDWWCPICEYEKKRKKQEDLN